jgi:ubiquinone/menaquinone biosynthesis C-methylase UbiE
MNPIERQEQRQAEWQKYARVYAEPVPYAMGARRKRAAVDNLQALTVRGSYLDVGAGLGEMLDAAEQLGFSPAMGTDVVPKIIDGERVRFGSADALPFADKSFDVVSMFDVAEHLVPGDDELACYELKRVARRYVLLTACNTHSVWGDPTQELHINRRPYEAWDKLFAQWFAPHPTRRLPNPHLAISETWLVDTTWSR